MTNKGICLSSVVDPGSESGRIQSDPTFDEDPVTDIRIRKKSFRIRITAAPDSPKKLISCHNEQPNTLKGTQD